jgi:hypothetical protein
MARRASSGTPGLPVVIRGILIAPAVVHFLIRQNAANFKYCGAGLCFCRSGVGCGTVK